MELNTNKKTNYRWIVCGFLWVAVAVNYVDRTALSAATPIIMKEFNIDGSFLYQYPIDTKDIGATKIVIANNSRNYFRKNTADTVEIFAANLPLTNKIVQTRNARLRPIGKDKYILTPMDKSNLVKIIVQLKKRKDDETYTPIDSTEIEIK